LSILDLLDAGTVDLDLAAYLMARVSRGASFMVGARPGGAGKTTVMCALLNVCPVGVTLVAATSDVVRRARTGGQPDRRAYVCHEIGAGPYFAYLWGADLRAYCALAGQGHQLATNLHADDLDEARRQVCMDNGVPETHFAAFPLMVFLRVGGGMLRAKRTIATVYESDGQSPHRLVFDAAKGTRPAAGSDPWVRECRDFLGNLHATDNRTIEATRERVVGFLEAYGPV